MDLHARRMIVLAVFFGIPTVVALGIGLFDIWVYYHWGPEVTVSQSMQELPPMLTFMVGFVLGALIFGIACHFWWAIK